MDYIPVVDLSKISGSGPVNKQDFKTMADNLYNALSGIGFAYLSNHGIDNKIIETAFTESKKFFELPEEEKNKSLKDISKSYNGYAKPGQELLHPGSSYEIRESYDFYGQQRYFPESPKEFGPSIAALEEACKPIMKNLLRALAISIGLDDEDFFVKCTKHLDDPNGVPSYTTIRSLYYPRIPSDIQPGTIRCADHSDNGILTFLFQDDIGGLEVKSVSGKWVPAKPIPGTILLNTGDLLEFWSGGKYPATRHRVLIPEVEIKKKTPRQSIAFFVHADHHVIVRPLTENAKEYEEITAKEHGKRKLVSTYQY